MQRHTTCFALLMKNMLRIIDEDKSEPDGYLYAASMFAPVKLPKIAEQVLIAANQ